MLNIVHPYIYKNVIITTVPSGLMEIVPPSGYIVPPSWSIILPSGRLDLRSTASLRQDNAPLRRDNIALRGIIRIVPWAGL